MHITPISLESTKKDKARMLLAQPQWENSQLKRDAKQVYQLELQNEDVHFIDTILQTGLDKDIDLIIFPEFSIPQKLHNKIQDWTAQNKIIVIAGSTYLERKGKFYNTASLFYQGKKYLTEKTKLSPHEVSKIIGLGPATGEVQHYFTNTTVGNVAIMICADEFESNVRTNFLKEDIDLLCVIAVQSKSKEHYQSIDRIVKEYDKGIYVAYCNALCEGLANGGTAFFGNDYPDTFMDSKNAGLTNNDGIDKKIIELQGIPGCLIVECDLGQKVVTYPNSGSWRSLMRMELPYKFENSKLEQFSPININILKHEPINKSAQKFIPSPPELYTKPRYLASQTFVGRKAELDALNDWASPANSYSILLFEAMGGAGKSMLTWEWVNNYARKLRRDWKGIFWYSFYEKGAIMSDFCQHALAYITGEDLDSFRKMKTPALVDLLIPELNNGPWLIILDGLERVLESYNSNRFAEDPSEISIDDAEINSKKDPCSCINDEDDELLLRLSSATPSKILASSRLIPRKLLNVAGQSIPGVQRYQLPGLRPIDAEAMFRNCGINGDADSIQSYLVTNCDCHPLTIGVLAGLINNYMRDKGNFDKWVNDSVGGRSLNLAKLDLKGKQNHILDIAMNMLTPKSRQLLSTMALIYEAIDYDTLAIFNPHMPILPNEVPEPKNPKSDWKWERLSEDEKTWRQKRYNEDLILWKAYERAMKTLKNSVAYQKAPEELEKTVQDLEQRGLLQYDRKTRRYELHPVVRFVSSGRLNLKETKQYGQRVVDYFSSKSHTSPKHAKTLEDVSDSIHVVRTLLRMGHYQQAFDTYKRELVHSLLYSLEAYKENLTLIQPFFQKGWTNWPSTLHPLDQAVLATSVVTSLSFITDDDVFYLYEMLVVSAIKNSSPNDLCIQLNNIAIGLSRQKKFAAEKRMIDFSLSISEIENNLESLFLNRLALYDILSKFGRWVEADETWFLLDPMGRDWDYKLYRPGLAEKSYAFSHLLRGDLQEENISNALQMAIKGNNRHAIRFLYWVFGIWYFKKGEWLLAVENFNETIRLSRSVSVVDSVSETMMATAKYHLNQLPEQSQEAERLTTMKNPANLELAELWHVIGNYEKAKKYALEAYKNAWASGEPYVHRYDLNEAITLLNKLRVQIPSLPPYSLDAEIIFPWEEKVAKFIERLKSERKKK